MFILRNFIDYCSLSVHTHTHTYIYSIQLYYKCCYMFRCLCTIHTEFTLQRRNVYIIFCFITLSNTIYRVPEDDANAAKHVTVFVI